MGAYDFNFDLPAGETLVPDAARVAALARLLPARPFSYMPTADDRPAWDRWRGTAFGERVLKTARELAGKPFPNYTDEVYETSLDAGDLPPIGQCQAAARHRQTAFLLAEAIYDAGEFLGVIQADFQRLAQLRTWINPHEDLRKKNFRREVAEADLCVVHFAENLALTSFVLGGRLPESFHAAVRAELDARVFRPLRERIEQGRDLTWWLRIKHNWLSVCLSGIAHAAVATMPDATDRAWWLAFAQGAVSEFRESFTADGCCTEGVGYWSYGFMHFIILAEVLRFGTGGVVDLLDEPKWKRVALFPERAEIEPGVYPSFADSGLAGRPLTWVTLWLDNRTGANPSHAAPAKEDATASLGLHVAAESMLWMFRTRDPLQPVRPASTRALRDWFEASTLLVCRPGPSTRRRFCATIIGGNNGVNHNHNDLGTYTVILDGRTVLLDPGPEAYTFRTFSERRYDSQLLNSYGHPVPRVGGALQHYGADWQTRVVAKEFTPEVDRLVLDLRNAYDVPALQRLTREFVFDRRGEGSLTIVDRVEFGAPTEFETALITCGRVTVDGTTIKIQDQEAALEIAVNGEGAAIEFVADTINQPPHPTRLAVRCREKVLAATIAMVIRPARP